MFKQPAGRKALPQSLLWTLLVCLTVFFLVGCTSNYNLTGTTTNGNGHQGSTTSGGSTGSSTGGSTGSTGGSTGSTGSTGGSTGSTGGSTGSTGSTGSSTGSTGSRGSGTWQITGLDVTVSPSSYDGMACSSQQTFTYTATIHIAPNGSGGSIEAFHSMTAADNDWQVSPLTVQPGQTTATFQFSDTGTLPGVPNNAHPAFPRPGYAQVPVNVSQDSNVFTEYAIPTGSCSL